MIRGKKGYDRLIYACKTVFTQPKTWLFCDKTIQSKSQAEHSKVYVVSELMHPSSQSRSPTAVLPHSFHFNSQFVSRSPHPSAKS